MRVEINELCEGLPQENLYGFIVRLNAPHVSTSMLLHNNVRFHRERSRYPRELRATPAEYDTGAGWRLVEPDGRVRMGIAPGHDCSVELPARGADELDFDVFVLMPCQAGRYVDLLLPMLPAPCEIFDREMVLGRASALDQADAFWASVPGTAARVHVPEREINETIRHSLKFSEVLAEKNPETGKYCKVNGSLAYADLWATPAAMDLVMMMDALGRHETVARYLDIFRDEQGTVIPPGDAYEPHPGYLSTPALYKSIDWLADHGAVLFTLAMHGLLSGDEVWTEHFTDTLVKACEWVVCACAIRGHGGVEGLPPAAVATDRRTSIQAAWSLGWIYKGITAAIRLLRRTDHPRAAEFAEFARDYRETFVKAYEIACWNAPTWTGADGRRRCLPPTALSGDAKDETRHPFYLDTGPLFLVFSGLLGAEDAAMEGARLWFREGPPRRFYRRDANFIQIGALEHEMSSAEPCYSWNVFHSWQQGYRDLFLEGMYSLFAGAVSRKTFISCETRGGITGNVFAAPLAIWLARLSVVDDEIEEGALHLLRLMPAAWLGARQTAAFEAMPTAYGPVSLRTQVSEMGDSLDVAFSPSFRFQSPKVMLHVPPLTGLKCISVNGVTYAPQGTIVLERDL